MFAKLLGSLSLIAVVFVPSQSAELRSVDWVATDGWRYFHYADLPDNGIAAFDAALESSDFYNTWMTPDFAEADVMGAPWRVGDLGLGFSELSPTGPGGVFFRKTFETSNELTQFGIGIRAANAIIVYVDGVEVLRRNCCLDSFGELTDAPFGIRDRAVDPGIQKWYRHAEVSDMTLAPGDHTIGVAVYAAPQGTGLGLHEFRLFSPMNERTWTGTGANDDWSNRENWLFGVPGESEFAVFRIHRNSEQMVDERININEPVQVEGLQLTGNYSYAVLSGETITLAGADGTARLDAFETGLISVHAPISLATNTLAQVDADLRLQDINFNGNSLTKTGAGRLTFYPSIIGSRNGPGELKVIEGVVAVDSGLMPIDIHTDGGVVEIDGAVELSGDFSGDLHLILRSRDGFGFLDGGGSGTATVDQLTVSLSHGFTPVDGAVYPLLQGWESVGIRNYHLPQIGNAEWDISRLGEGVVSIIHQVRVCDFDASAYCDVHDINALSAEVISGGNSLDFDTNLDGELDRRDVDFWLADAADANGFASAFLLGDRNLDGTIDFVDLGVMRRLWQRETNYYSSGDFDLSGFIDAADLNILGRYWNQSLDEKALATVPEPITPWSVTLTFLLWMGRRHWELNQRRTKFSTQSVAPDRQPREPSVFHSAVAGDYLAKIDGDSISLHLVIFAKSEPIHPMSFLPVPLEVA